MTDTLTPEKLAEYWRNEARYMDVAVTVGDDVTAEYGARAIETADTIDALRASLDAAIERAEKAEADHEKTFVLGQEDGYADAVQWIDVHTGGDGEYVYCTDLDPERHTPDAATMQQRIVDRFDALKARVAEMEGALLAARPHIREQYAAAHIPTSTTEKARNIRIKVLGEVSDKIDAALKEKTNAQG